MANQRQADAADRRPPGLGLRTAMPRTCGSTRATSPSGGQFWAPRTGTAAGAAGSTWPMLATADALPKEAIRFRRLSPNMKWDITTDPRIGMYQCEAGNCLPTGQTKTVDPAVVRDVRAGMRSGRH